MQHEWRYAMKTKTALIALMMLLNGGMQICPALPASMAEQPTEVTVILSPFLPEVERTKLQAALIKFALVDCPNGARFTVYDGWELKVVADVQLPRLNYDSPRARATRAEAALSSLKQWLAWLEPVQAPAKLRGSYAVKIPESLYAVTARPAENTRSIVIVGSPFYVSLTEPSFSMEDARYPSDGHLSRATPETIYGTADRHGRLANTIIHWCYPSEDIWISENHRYAVTRWWTLYVTSQGGVLATFNSDTAQVLSAATRTDHRAVGEFTVNSGDNEVVMHVASQRNILVPSPVSSRVVSEQPPAAEVSEPAPTPPAPVAPTEATPVLAPAPVAPPPPLVETPQPPTELPPKPEPISALPVPTEIPKPATGHVGIAAVWSVPPGAPQAADIDLYVSARPGAPEVSWRRSYSSGTTFYRDIRSAGAKGNNDAWRMNWEYVEVSRQDDLSKISVWLNAYRTHSSVSGLVRVQYQGQIVDRPFAFNVTRGNAGWDSALAARWRSPYWQEIRLEKFFNSAGSS
jgi:hypothetical protein